MNKAIRYSFTAALKKLVQLINIERKEVGQIYFYAVLIGAIQLSLPLGIQAIVGLLFGGILSVSLMVLIAFVVVGVFLGGVIQVMQMNVTENIQQRIFTRLTFAYAYRIPRIDLLSIDNYYLPELVNRFFDTANLQKGLAKLLLDVPTASIQIIFGIILLSFYHPAFAVFGFILLIFIVFIVSGSSNKGLNSSMEESDYKYRVGHWLEEISRAIKTFKFTQKGQFHLTKVDQLVLGYLAARRLHFKVLVFQYKTLVAFKVLITASMLIIGTLLFLNQKINLGQFIAAELIIIAVLNSVEKLIISLATGYDVLTAIEKLDHVLQKPQDRDLDRIKGFEPDYSNGFNLSVRNLGFSFPNGKKVLDDVSFDLKPGEKICISGNQGSGKTTLIRVLSGLYGGYSGQILVNELPLHNIPVDDWRNGIAVFFAQEELFNGTLLENLILGNTERLLDEINETCKLVGLLPFIQSKVEGYQMVIDSQGQKLPHSVIQKILLARCLLRKPLILMMENGWEAIELEYRQHIIEKLTSDKSFSLIAITDLPELLSVCDRSIQITKKQ
ncbi:peptidase domain-containing ABC transporter [Daejeonella sp.]|jgi:ABC-type bacteriocin/lantibiotic exporter with double-glycine peptidase domain|uniref:peptidase domain-containing ABC transporter n=1 Tax=Daejeonella sp. TaxID=2805397 RepID=UPI00378461A4